MRRYPPVDEAARAAVLDTCRALVARGLYPGRVRLVRLVRLAGVSLGERTLERVRDRLIADGLLVVPPGLSKKCAGGFCGLQGPALDGVMERRHGEQMRRAAAIRAERGQFDPLPDDLAPLVILNAAEAARILPRLAADVRRLAYRDLVRREMEGG